MKDIMKKSAYYVIAADMTWKRGLNLLEIQKGYLKNGVPKTTHAVYQMVLEPCTDEEATNVMNCFSVTNYGDLLQCEGLSKEDLGMIDRLFIGWVLTLHETKSK